MLKLLREGRVESDNCSGDLHRCPVDRGSDEVLTVLRVVLPKLERYGRGGDERVLRIVCAGSCL